MNAKLIGTTMPCEHVASANPTSVGRDPSNDIVLPVGTVSRFHAEIGMDGGRYYLEDVGSTYGTYLNDIQIEGRVQIEDGDRIMFGKSARHPETEFEFVFRAPRARRGMMRRITGMFTRKGTERVKGKSAPKGTVDIQPSATYLMVRLSGVLRKPEWDDIGQRVESELRTNPLNVILDVSEVKYMNSYAIGHVNKMVELVDSEGQTLVVAGAQGTVRKLFTMVGLEALVTMVDSPGEAIDLFGGV